MDKKKPGFPKNGKPGVSVRQTSVLAELVQKLHPPCTQMQHGWQLLCARKLEANRRKTWQYSARPWRRP
ncbi:MAG: hypothetical protein Q4A28_05890 [Brachymonas sp.]|nr:hypothetical protein [Brachymonas sp.]